jgi:negative regulator of flagellin synthesis FlgM
MSIEINGQHPPLTPSNSEGTNKAEKRDEQTVTQHPANRSADKGDSVKLTDTVNIMRKMEAKLSTVSEVDEQRVDSIKQSITNGSFEINPDRIAEKLIGFENMFRNR